MSTNQLNKKITPIQKKANNREVGMTGREKIKKTIAKTPLSLVCANAMYSRRKLHFSGKETSGRYSSGEERIHAVEPMEQDEVNKENCIFVRDENDVAYISLKMEKPTTAKIKEEVTKKFNLTDDAIEDIEFDDGRKSINVRNDDGTLQKRSVRHGDRLFILKGKADGPKPFTLVEQGNI